jgi:hypothetical protein
MKNPIVVPYILTVLAIVFPPFTYGTAEVTVEFIREWKFIGSGKKAESINMTVLAFELLLLWGGYFIYMKAQRAKD